MSVKHRTCVNCGRDIYFNVWGMSTVKLWRHAHSNNTSCMLHAEPDRT